MSSAAYLSALSQTYPPASTFSVDQIPDLSNKIVAITGGYTGIGYETCKALLNKNATVYILGRSQAKGDQAIARLQQETNGTGKVEMVVCDLADLKSVRASTDELKNKVQHLDILFNNGGVMVTPVGSVTKHGHELQFGTNCLGHYHLTTLLLPLLLASPFKSDGFPRVVNTSSSAHLFATSGIEFDSLKVDKETGKFTNARGKEALYAQSKLANILFANELHRRYASQGLIATSCNPGNLKTELARHSNQYVFKLLNVLLLYPASQGALTQLWAGTSEFGKDLGAKFLIPWAREGPCLPIARDEELAQQLWEYCQAECQGF